MHKSSYLLAAKSNLTMWIAICLWIITQIITVIHYWGVPQMSDAYSYCFFAIRVADNNVFYPTKEMVTNGEYIFNPGFINYLSLVWRTFGSMNYALVFNIILNFLLLASIFRIALKTASRSVANWTATLFCLLSSNTLIVPQLMTELPFLSLTMCSVALLTEKKKASYLLSGLILVLANYIRPTAILYFIPCFLFLMFIRRRIKDVLCYTGGILAGVVLLLTFNHRVSGGSLFLSSTTMGINMRMGAFDKATGGYTPIEKSALDIDPENKMNVFDKNRRYRNDAVEWILNNRSKWLALSASKLFYLFATDYWIESPLPRHRSHLRISARKSELFMYSCVYYLAIVLAAVGIWNKRRELWGIYGLVLMPLVGTLLMTVLTVGAPRYHYPAMPVILFFASTAICQRSPGRLTLSGKSISSNVMSRSGGTDSGIIRRALRPG